MRSLLRLDVVSLSSVVTRPPLVYLLLFLVSFVILFLGMDRGIVLYDEGLMLVGAMRVAAGQVPHRDFYANYGPAQFYTLAWLFRLFGRSILTERIYDLALRAATITLTYKITATYCRKWIALCTTIVCAFWLFGAVVGSIATPIIPILFLILLGSLFLFPVFHAEVRSWRVLAAGGIAGLTALFRYDVGFAMTFVHVCSIVIAAFLRRGSAAQKAAWITSVLPPYFIGVTAVFLPFALLYLSVAPIHPFVHDVILFPTKYYARARRLPFPGLHGRSLENMAIYLPIVVDSLCLYSVITAKDRNRTREAGTDNIARNQSWIGLLILFGLLSAAFYFKGIIRIAMVQMLLSLVPTVIALAGLYEYSSRKGKMLHRIVQWTMALSIFTATWSALKEVRVLYLSHESVLQEVMSPPGPASIRAKTEWCSVPNPLHTGLCFLVDPGHAKIISYISAHTSPGEPIFIGLTRHDRLVSNDLLTYFAAGRLPATRWSHFDPDLQTRADIQTEMIHELDRQGVRYVILESQFDSLVEASNDSSKSSGVTLLDDYIRRNYHQLETFDALSLWLRNGAGA